MTQVRLEPARLRAVGHGMHLGGWDADASSLVIALVPGSSFPYIYRRLGGSTWLSQYWANSYQGPL